jgi:hypothetical protein
MEEQLVLTEEEVSFLVIKYLYDQKQQGRDHVSLSEVYQYLGNDLPDDEEDVWLCINEDGEGVIAFQDEQRKKSLN